MADLSSISPFEAIRHTRDGHEIWSARELAPLLGYTTWRNFTESIERAQAACDNSGQDARNHFVAASKMVGIGSGSERSVLDFHLTRYAAYLVAMNGDPRKPEVAAAQTYFAIRTHEAETARARDSLTPALAPASSLALARQMLEALEQQEVRVAAIEQRLDLAPIQGAQVGTLHTLCQELGRLMGNYRRAYRLLYDRFGLASYRDVPQGQYDEVVQFVRVQIAAYSGRPVLLDGVPG